MMKLRNLLFAFLVVAVLAACGPSKTPTQPEPAQPGVPTPAAAPAPASGGEAAVASAPTSAAVSGADMNIEPDATVATVGTEKITNRDLSTEVKLLERRYASQIPPEYMAQMRPRFREQALSTLVHQAKVSSVLMAEAAREHIQPTSGEVDAALMKIEGQLQQQGATLDMLLKMRGWSKDELRKQLEGDLIKQQLVEKKREAAHISDASVEAFYEANKERMKQPPEVRASHILFATKSAPGHPGLPVEVARASAEEVLGWIKAGSDFAELARKYSDDPGSAMKGGDLGFFSEGQMVGPFNDAAFGLKEGEISDLVPTQYGFHIIKKTGEKNGGIPTLAESEEMIRKQLENQVVGRWLQGLTKDIKVTYANPADDPANQQRPAMPGGTAEPSSPNPQSMR